MIFWCIAIEIVATATLDRNVKGRSRGKTRDETKPALETASALLVIVGRIKFTFWEEFCDVA
jgi:hypothetical protein